MTELAEVTGSSSSTKSKALPASIVGGGELPSMNELPCEISSKEKRSEANAAVNTGFLALCICRPKRESADSTMSLRVKLRI